MILLHLARSAVLGITLLTGTGVAAAADTCGGGGPCDEPHGGLGCTWNACCESVCEFVASCCDIAWDEFCVEIALEFCADLACGQPDSGPCDAVGDGPGCLDEPCCFLTCRLDPFCCGGAWDAWCVTQAAQVCGAPQCELVAPEGVRLEADECEERMNDGCNIPTLLFGALACGESIVGTVFTGSPRDADWYEVQLDRPTTLTATFTPEFPGEVMVVQGPCDATRVLDVRNGFGCTATTLTIDLDPGAWWVVVSTASEVRSIHRGLPCIDPEDPESPLPAFNTRYLLTLACEGSDGGADLNGDGVVDGADLGILLQAWGPCANCPADLDGDGNVTGADLGILLQAWTP